MNERIKELVEKTGYILDSDKFKTGMPVDDEFVERFAEFLIQECAEIADDKYDCGKFPVGCHILEHLGVKQ